MKQSEEIRERVRAKFLQDTSGERVDGYLLRDNFDGTVSIAIVQNIEEIVLAEAHAARRAAFEEALAAKADRATLYAEERYRLGYVRGVAAKEAAIRAKMEGE